MIRRKRGPASFRINFRQTVLSENPDGSFRVRIEPEPDQFERVTEGGTSYLRDRFTHAVFSERRLMESVARAIATLPLRYEPSEITDQTAYVDSRIPSMISMLEGQGKPRSLGSAAHEVLVRRLGEAHRFAIVTLDLRNHAELLSDYTDMAASTINVALSHEIALAARAHQGYLWKASGGTLSLFFSAPNLISKTDLAFGFATLARDLVTTLNALLMLHDGPWLQYRFAIEVGEATAQLAGADEVHAQVDLVGEAVAVAEELARYGVPGTILVGPRAAAACHTSWQKRLRELATQPALSLTDDFGQPGVVRELIAGSHGVGPLTQEP